jgi:hypothetical protein
MDTFLSCRGHRSPPLFRVASAGAEHPARAPERVAHAGDAPDDGLPDPTVGKRRPWADVDLLGGAAVEASTI